MNAINISFKTSLSRFIVEYLFIQVHRLGNYLLYWMTHFCDHHGKGWIWDTTCIVKSYKQRCCKSKSSIDGLLTLHRLCTCVFVYIPCRIRNVFASEVSSNSQGIGFYPFVCCYEMNSFQYPGFSCLNRWIVFTLDFHNLATNIPLCFKQSDT